MSSEPDLVPCDCAPLHREGCPNYERLIAYWGLQPALPGRIQKGSHDHSGTTTVEPPLGEWQGGSKSPEPALADFHALPPCCQDRIREKCRWEHMGILAVMREWPNLRCEEHTNGV